MKIGQFSDSFLPIVDGVGRVVYNYCDTLAKKGEDVTAIVPMTEMGNRGQYPFDIIDFISEDLPLTAYNTGLPTFDIHYDKRLSMTDFDIVHLHTPFVAGIEAIKYAKRRNVPVVATFHSKYYDDFYQITNSKKLATFGTDALVEFYNRCSEVWTVSENSAETLRSYGYEKEIYVIENGLDLKDVDYALAIEARKYFNLNNDPVLLYVGQINWKKNLLRILEACSLLKKDGFKFQLVFAGKGPHEKEVLEKAKELGLEECFHMVGHLNDENLLYGLYALASLFVFPSTYDTYSMVVREAANAQTASVVVRNSAPSECIKDKVNGLLCEDDSTSLYAVLKDYINDEVKMIKLGVEAKKTIPVAWDVVIDQALERYKYLIDSQK